jgi:DHA2 family methylenomycin A resistance protein-like MFS transporter
MALCGTTTKTDAGSAPRVLAIMCAGMFLVLLDVTIVNVALPSIGRDLGASVSGLQWVIDAYAVTIASLLLAGGTLGDRLGHRRVLLLGFALFGLASLGCALAPGAGVLIAARIVQGAGGALLLPSTMAIIADVYPDSAAQSRALGTWAAVSSLALPAGPLLGGLLVGAATWQWVFWINVPLAAAAIIASLLVVPDRPGRQHGRFDVLGLAGLIVGLGAFVFTVISAGRHAGTAVLTTGAVVTVAAFAIGLRAERRAPNPVLPLALLGKRTFVAPNAVALTMNLVFNGLLFVGTLYLQDVRGRTPLEAGLLVLPLAVPLVALAPVSGRLTAARGPRTAVVLGCAIAAPGPLFLLGVQPGSGLGWLAAGFAVLGCGAGLVTASVVAAAVQATPAHRSGLATGMSNTARQTGTACGVAVFGAICGSPDSPGRFVLGLHGLAIAASALWVIAVALAATGIARRTR